MAKLGGPGPKTKFKPGQSGNPGGRAKIPEDIKQARTMTNHQLMRRLTDFLQMDRDAVRAIAQDPKAPMLDVIVASIVAKAATASDHQRLNFLFDRIVGKVTDKIEVNPFSEMSLEDLIILAKQKIPELEGK